MPGPEQWHLAPEFSDTQNVSKPYLCANSNSERLTAHLAAFSRQMPLMYVMLLINTWKLSVTYYGVARSI